MYLSINYSVSHTRTRFVRHFCKFYQNQSNGFRAPPRGHKCLRDMDPGNRVVKNESKKLSLGRRHT